MTTFNFQWNSSFTGAASVATTVLYFNDTIQFPYDLVIPKQYMNRKFRCTLNIVFQNTNTSFGGVHIYSSIKSDSYNKNTTTVQFPTAIASNFTYHGFASCEASQGSTAACQAHMHSSESIPMTVYYPNYSQIQFTFITNAINAAFFSGITCNYIGNLCFELIE